MTRRDKRALLVVTGASGTGKTTLVRALEARRLSGVSCFYFDSVGVPTVEEMVQRYGSGEGWQAALTEQWVERLAALTPAGELAVLDGQVRPSVVRQAVAQHPRFDLVEIVLLDCSHAVRDARLRNERGQPELASPEMAAWAAYLRGQCDALALPRIDTTDLTVAAAAAALEARAMRLRALAAG